MEPKLITTKTNLREAARALGIRPSVYWREVVAPVLMRPDTPDHVARLLQTKAIFDAQDILPQKVEQAVFDEFIAAPYATGLQLFSRKLHGKYAVHRAFMCARMLTYLERALAANPRPPYGLPHPPMRYLSVLIPGNIPQQVLDQLHATGRYPITLGRDVAGTLEALERRREGDEKAKRAARRAEQAANPKTRRFDTPRAARAEAAAAIHAQALRERLEYVVAQGHSVTLKGLADFIGRQTAALQGFPLQPDQKVPPSLRPNPAALINYIHAEMRPTLDHHDPELFVTLRAQARAVAALLPENPVANVTRDALLAA